MGYTPITEEQAQKDAKEQRERFLPWPAGKYAFEVAASIDAGFTKNSYPMMLLELNIYNETGTVKLLKDYLPMDGQMAYKFRHAAIACGLQVEYETGILLPYMFAKRRGELFLKIDPKQPKKDDNKKIIPGVFWDEKNSVEDYFTEDVKQEAANATPAVIADLDDEIPF